MILQENKMSVASGKELIATPINEIIDEIKSRGYQLKCRREATCLYCIELNRWIAPDSFNVDEHYYFEDVSNMDRDRAVYAISLPEGLKGFLVDTCFVYEDNISAEMLQKLKLEYALPAALQV